MSIIIASSINQKTKLRRSIYHNWATKSISYTIVIWVQFTLCNINKVWMRSTVPLYAILFPPPIFWSYWWSWWLNNTCCTCGWYGKTVTIWATPWLISASGSKSLVDEEGEEKFVKHSLLKKNLKVINFLFYYISKKNYLGKL